jgi:shikimate kinase
MRLRFLPRVLRLPETRGVALKPPVTRIVLVGFMGVGKTTVGQVLANRLGWGFLDLDDWIEEQNGTTVAQIFREKGEPYFRDEERRAAQAAGTRQQYVIGAGGGAFVQSATREVLKVGAATVWLVCDLDAVLHRIAPDGSRPLATDRERMQALMAEREAAYRQADLTVDTTDASPETVATRIVEALFPERSEG